MRTLDRLVGTWTITGDTLTGRTTFEWLPGGFYLVQHFEANHAGRAIDAVEYIGFDEDTRTLRSHMMDNAGSNFTYTWQLDGDVLAIWFGEKGSDNFFTGTFDPDGDSYTGGWQWPDGSGGTSGYTATMTRVKEPAAVNPPVPPGALLLELVLVPVADVDRAKAFYRDSLGFRLDVDVKDNGVRVVQLTPPGSACSITLTEGLPAVAMPPGVLRGLHLVVADIEAARAELVGRGVEVGEVEDSGGVLYAYFADPDGNTWCLQHMPWR
ncbi:hypothetical protein GCM10029964_076960 [Kibdelosporangium lantanae]